MIESFRDDSLSKYYWDGEGHKDIPTNIKSALQRKLDLIHAAEAECDLLTVNSEPRLVIALSTLRVS